MKKNKKDLSPEEIKRKKFKRFKRKIRRLILLAVVASIAYGVYKPEVIPFAPLANKVSSTKASLTKKAPQAEAEAKKLLGVTTEKVEEITKNTKIPTQFTGLPEEVVVEDIVESFTEEVKKLPDNQVKRIKVQFCQDVINEATMSASE